MSQALEPALCSDLLGERQSPINISSATPIGLTDIVFDYGIGDLEIINNGQTIQANVHGGFSIHLDGGT